VRSSAEAVAPLVEDYEIVAVDDGSRDQTPRILAHLKQEMGNRLSIVTHGTNLGYGTALRAGFDAARGRLIFYTDADNQFDLRSSSISPAWRSTTPFSATAWAARTAPSSHGLERLQRSRVLRLRNVGRDLNCSFKLFRREALTSLHLEEDHFFIDTGIVVQLHRAGYRYMQKGSGTIPGPPVSPR
jgi:glycosyltransferase involved in cell wall biosynthesis